MRDADLLNDELDENYDYGDDVDLPCTWCGGDGTAWGYEFGDPLWYDENECYPCPACSGSGNRRDQRLF